MKFPFFQGQRNAKELYWLLLSILNVLSDIGVSIKQALCPVAGLTL